MKNIYIASCVENGGVYLCDFENEKLSARAFYPLKKPMYLAKDGQNFYIPIRNVSADCQNSGLVKCRINDISGELSDFENPISTEGLVACHLCVKGADSFFTNYLSGSVSRIRNGKCDKISAHSGKGVHPTRQEAPHTHYVNFTPDGKYLVSTDLGIDKIFVYGFDLNEISSVDAPNGCGPRHLIFSHDCKKMYCVNELASSVSVYLYDSFNGNLTLSGTFSALPSDFHGENTAAAIRLSSDGKYLYVSNRGHDSISIFEVLDDTLKLLKCVRCGGKGPRDFDIKDGYLFCTNEGTGNVTVFKCDGANLTLLDTELQIPGALCVLFG